MALFEVPRRPPFGAHPGQSPSADYLLNQCLLLPMGEAGGAGVRDVTGHNVGTFHGTNLLRQSGQPFGNAALLDGSTNWIEIPADTSFTGDIINSPGPVFSIAVWFKWHSCAETYGLLYGEEDSATFNMSLFVKSDGTQAIYFTTGNSDPVTGSSAITQDVWHLMVVTNGFPNGTQYYMDGVLIHNFANWTGVQISNSNFRARIGGGSIFGSGRFVNGAIGPVAKWYRQLNHSEVKRLYSEPASILAYYRTLRSAGGTPASQTLVGDHGVASTPKFGCVGGTVELSGVQAVYGTCGNQGIAHPSAVPVQGALAVAPNLTGDTGVSHPSKVPTQGTVVANFAITGTYGIKSGPTVPTGGALILALNTGRPTSVFLGSQDVTDLIIFNTLNITDTLGAPSTAVGQIQDPAGALHPLVGQRFLIYHNLKRIFGGSVEESTESSFQASGRIVADIKCIDFSSVFDRRVIGQTYPNPVTNTLTSVVSDIVTNTLAGEGITYDSSDGDPGINLGPLVFNWIYIRQAFNQLAQLTGWEFSVDPYGVLKWFPKSSGISAAPFTLRDNDGHVLTIGSGSGQSATIRTYRGKYRNREFVLSNTQATSQWCDTFSAAIPGPFPLSLQPPDGTRFAFFTLYPISATPSVKVNTNSQRVIPLTSVNTAPAGSWDWYWIPPQGFGIGGNGVFQNPANARLQSTDTLVVCYQISLPPVQKVQSLTEIANRAAIEGTTGYYDDVMQAQDVTDPSTLLTLAQGALTRFGASGIPSQIVFTTRTDGLAVGQLIDTQLSQPVVAQGFFQISNLVTTEIDKTYLQYQATADSGANQGDWTAFFQAVQRRSQLILPANREIHTWQLAPSYPGIVNPGIPSSGILGQPYVVQNAAGLLQYVTLFFSFPPSGQDMIFDILLNNSGVLGQRVFPAGTNTPQVYAFPNTATRVYAGDVLLFYVVQAGSVNRGNDGTCTLVISVSA